MMAPRPKTQPTPRPSWRVRALEAYKSHGKRPNTPKPRRLPTHAQVALAGLAIEIGTVRAPEHELGVSMLCEQIGDIGVRLAAELGVFVTRPGVRAVGAAAKAAGLRTRRGVVHGVRSGRRY